MLVDVIYHALLISGFVGIMMLVVEYLNVLSHGTWQERLAGNKWAQYLAAAVLGGIPGCLGAFTAVAMYSHGVLSSGALITAMIATSGDEAFVMLALFPRDALLLTLELMIIGTAAGWLTDKLAGPRLAAALFPCQRLQTHDVEECHCFPTDDVLSQLREPSLARGVLMVSLLLFVGGIVSGAFGPEAWNWIRFTLLASGLIALFIVATVPEHFLEEHLWNHIAKRHVVRIFIWTFGALLVTHVIAQYLNLADVIRSNTLSMILISALVGIIPESGPHLIFTTFYSQGLIPFVVLLTSSIVQDGHGMLPLLAYSRKQFVIVKAINLLVGLLVGLVVYFIGFYF